MSSVKDRRVFDSRRDFGYEEKHKTELNIPRIITAGVSGLAGGVVLATVIAGAAASMMVAAAGSLAGAAITGYAEYAKEKRSMRDE